MLERFVIALAAAGCVIVVQQVADYLETRERRKEIVRELIDAREDANDALDQCRDELGRKWEESYRLEERDCSADGACKYTVLVPID